MERNDERREWERYGRGPRERGVQRWERGEVGPGHTGAPERLYGDEQDWDRDRRRTYSGESEGDRPERHDTWPQERFGNRFQDRTPERYQDRAEARYDESRWGRDEQQGDRWGYQQSYQARPTRNYDEERQRRPDEANLRASQYGYRVGRATGARDEEGARSATWGPVRRGRAPRDYRRADDRIRDEIIECIVRDTDIDASDVEVQVAVGEVTLVGTVEDRAAKRGLEDVVERIFGVVDIHNNVKVRKSAWRQLGERLFGEGENNENDARKVSNPTTDPARASDPTRSAPKS
jgi:osmotically-inducible protein OsmY